MKIFNIRKITEKGRNGSKQIMYKNDWLEFHPEFHKANITIDECGYFDERPNLNFTLTTLIGFIGLIISPLIGIYFFLTMLAVVLFIPWGQFYLRLPFKTGNDEECDSPRWGFYFYGEGLTIPDNFVICRGEKTKFFYLPWSYTWVRTSLLKKDGKWEHEIKGSLKDFYEDKWNSVCFIETHPYLYTLKSGEQQLALATIKVREMEWRPIWFKWTNAFSHIRKSIDISFSEEVGEGAGSWKGGTVGCSWDILPNETPYYCLKRMEVERKF